MDTESFALLVVFLPHALGGMFLGWRLLPREARAELRGWFREDDGGGSPPPEPVTPQGGGGTGTPPLPDAGASPVRLREPGRLSDHRPASPRRPAHPVEPQRTPTPR